MTTLPHDVEVVVRILVVLVMFGVGVDLRLRDFVRVREHVRLVFGVVIGHWIALVPTGMLIGRLLGVPAEVETGILLVAAAPAAALSCFYAQLASGDLALATTLAAVSNALAAFATPLVASLCLGASLGAFDRPALAIGPFVQLTLTGLVLPILAGMLVGHALAARLDRWRRALRVAGLLAISLMLAMIAVSEYALIVSKIADLAAAAAAFTLAMLVVGFAAAAAIRCDAGARRALPWAFPARNAAVALLFATSIPGAATTAAFVMILFLTQLAILVPAALWVGRRRQAPAFARGGRGRPQDDGKTTASR